MAIYTLHEGLFDKLKMPNLKRRRYSKEIKEISYSDFSKTLEDMEYILNTISKAMKKDAEKYRDSYPDGVIDEYDANYWNQQVKKNKTCQPSMYTYMNYDVDDIDFDENTIEHVMDNIYRAAEQLGFRFSKEYVYDESEPNDKYPNILVAIYDDSDSNSITCAIRMSEKVNVK